MGILSSKEINTDVNNIDVNPSKTDINDNIDCPFETPHEVNLILISYDYWHTPENVENNSTNTEDISDSIDNMDVQYEKYENLQPRYGFPNDSVCRILANRVHDSLKNSKLSAVNTSDDIKKEMLTFFESAIYRKYNLKDKSSFVMYLLSRSSPFGIGAVAQHSLTKDFYIITQGVFNMDSNEKTVISENGKNPGITHQIFSKYIHKKAAVWNKLAAKFSGRKKYIAGGALAGGAAATVAAAYLNRDKIKSLLKGNREQLDEISNVIDDASAFLDTNDTLSAKSKLTEAQVQLDAARGGTMSDVEDDDDDEDDEDDEDDDASVYEDLS